jgi:hypothetical protein
MCPLDYVAFLSLCSEFFNSPHLICNTTEGSSYHVKSSSDFMNIPSVDVCSMLLTKTIAGGYFYHHLLLFLRHINCKLSIHHFYKVCTSNITSLSWDTYSQNDKCFQVTPVTFLFYNLIPIPYADKCLNDLINPSLDGWRIHVQFWGKTTFKFFRKLVSWGWATHKSMKTKIFVLSSHLSI